MEPTNLPDERRRRRYLWAPCCFIVADQRSSRHDAEAWRKQSRKRQGAKHRQGIVPAAPPRRGSAFVDGWTRTGLFQPSARSGGLRDDRAEASRWPHDHGSTMTRQGSRAARQGTSRVPEANHSKGLPGMNVDIVVNSLDTASFFLAAPEIIGEQSLNSLSDMAHRFMPTVVMTAQKDSRPDETYQAYRVRKGLPNDPSFLQTLKALASNALADSFGISICVRAWHGTGSDTLWLRALSWAGLCFFGLGTVACTLFVLTSVFVIIVGQRRVSRVFVILGATLFVFTRGLAIWAAAYGVN
jgi:hypothetical protein